MGLISHCFFAAQPPHEACLSAHPSVRNAGSASTPSEGVQGVGAGVMTPRYTMCSEGGGVVMAMVDQDSCCGGGGGGGCGAAALCPAAAAVTLAPALASGEAPFRRDAPAAAVPHRAPPLSSPPTEAAPRRKSRNSDAGAAGIEGMAAKSAAEGSCTAEVERIAHVHARMPAQGRAVPRRRRIDPRGGIRTLRRA
jgi:hypothetical protein